MVELATDSQAAGAGGLRSRREAIADVALVGLAEVGDEVIVNVQALDLGLGSGGFDVVHVNLTRGLEGESDLDPGRAQVMKLNYTSLQHAVEPVEDEQLQLPVGRPVAVLALHGQLAGRRVGVRAGGCRAHSSATCRPRAARCPAGIRARCAMLRERGLLAGHLTAGAAFGGEGRGDHDRRRAAPRAARRSAGTRRCAAPGRASSARAPRSGTAAWSRSTPHTSRSRSAVPTLLVARMSSGDERTRHRGISHHTLTVLDLLLEPVTVALPAGMRSPVGADLRAGLGAVFGGAMPSQPTSERRALALDVDASRAHHAPRLAPRERRPAGLRRQRPAGRDDGSRAGGGPAVLRRARSPAAARSRSSSRSLPASTRAQTMGPGRRMSGSFEALGGETVYHGRIVDVRIERFRHADGEVVTREIVRHRGAVAIVAHDGEHVWLVRQPREAVGEPALLEIPAGRLDVDGERPLQAAQRELAEEIGRGAEQWEPILTYYTSAGFTDEQVHLFAPPSCSRAGRTATRTSGSRSSRGRCATSTARSTQCRDAKTLIGLMWLARRLNAVAPPRSARAASEAVRMAPAETARRRPRSGSSRCSSTSSPTSSSSAASRATRSRPTARTCCSSASSSIARGLARGERSRTASWPRSCRSSRVAPSTLARKVACLRSFYRHLRREGAIEHDPTADLRGPRKPQRLPRVLTREEVRTPARAAAGERAAGAARPRAARADVRVRPARVRGGRARARRRRPRGGPAVRARQGLQGADRADRAPGGGGAAARTSAAGVRR